MSGNEAKCKLHHCKLRHDQNIKKGEGNHENTIVTHQFAQNSENGQATDPMYDGGTLLTQEPDNILTTTVLIS